MGESRELGGAPGPAAQGVVLRAWRESLQLTADETGYSVGVSARGLRQWEEGNRSPSVGMIASLASVYGAAVALPDLLRALSTPSALDARSTWAHNFPVQSMPVWVWARSRSSTVALARFRWGAAFGEVTVPPGPSGTWMFSPACVDNPPIHVTWESGTDGWVDFGRGQIPGEVLSLLGVGLPAVNEVLRMTPKEGPADAHDHQRLSQVLRFGLGASRTLLAENGIPWRVASENLTAFLPNKPTHDERNVPPAGGLPPRI